MNGESVLLLAAESGDGQFYRLIDPELKRLLELDDVFIQESFFSSLQAKDLEAFDTVVVLRSPIPGHAKNDLDGYFKAIPLLVDFVHAGGGLVLMDSESYGKNVSALNELGRHFDISFAFNRIFDLQQDNNLHLPNMPEGKLIRCQVAPASPFGRVNSFIELVVEGGHGTQMLTPFAGAGWEKSLISAATCRSEPFPHGCYAGGNGRSVSAPGLCCHRNFGKGRVVAFPASAAFWVVNSFLPRWKGYLLRQNRNAGYDFLKGMWLWAGENSRQGNPSVAARIFKGRSIAGQKDFSFKLVPPDKIKELNSLRPFKLWIGFLPDDVTIEKMVCCAAGLQYHVLVILHNYWELQPQLWDNLHVHYRKLGDKYGLTVIPGYEQFDGEGNCSVVFNVDRLPEQRRRYANSNLLEDLQLKLNAYSAVLSAPLQNRIPPWRHGGYNLLETDNEEDLHIYHERIASGAFLSPVHIAGHELPGCEKWTNYLLAPDCGSALAAIRENRHFNYISSGPVLKRFFFADGRIIEDDWEGFWCEWDKGDEIKVEIELSASVNLIEVKLFDGIKLLQHFVPDEKEFKQTIRLEADHDFRLHLTAMDENGGRLAASYPLYTRNRHFWSHLGSDQMNDCHNVFVSDDNGSVGIGDRFYEPCGFVSFGFGWGDYIRIFTTLPWKEVMPQGVDVSSSLISNFKSFHPSPFIKIDDKFDFLNNHRRRLGKCTEDLHVVHSVADGSWLNRGPDAVWRDRHGKIFKPTRSIEKSRLWRCISEYRVPKWIPYAPVKIFIRQRLEWLREHCFSELDTLSFAHSLHMFMPSLSLVAGSRVHKISDIVSRDYVYRPAEHEKEWDNQMAAEYIKRPLANQLVVDASESAMITVIGDEAGRFLLRGIKMPGRILARAWMLPENRFLLSFELAPEKSAFNPGDVLELEYIITLTAMEY